ncbi:peroxiredoxin [Flagellimonas sp. S3867]|uniref:peroxiredoxin family protein n=1 Tax=Flagellimonas sp. S3867 TaxID=2768063 RepID=UPI00168955BF|nr:TlpA disulfide reductase family protein [Flagellimonas sp. S3867]
MKRIGLLAVSISLFLVSCKKEVKEELTIGDWWAKMDVSATDALPVTLYLSKDSIGNYQMEMHNAEESIMIDEIEIKGDSIRINMPVFEGYVTGTFSKNEIQGSFVKESLDRTVPFTAIYGKRDRFEIGSEPSVNISGIWETHFDIGTDEDYPAMGIFMQNGNIVKGTFRTLTGDYRFLEGVVNGDSLKLSTFDGTHVFLFTAKVTDSTLQGIFYSGNHSVEKFVAKRNEAYQLPDPNTLTYLKEGYDRFDFSFPDTNGNMISMSDDRFKNKPVLVQVMGTWCPNCLDETRFYVDYFKKNPDLDIEIVALAFEYAKTKEKAEKGIERLIKREKLTYPVLLAQYETSNKRMANEKLPMLNHVLSYPTTIYIDRTGAVKKIHTGFNGPATGNRYEDFTKEFDQTIRELTASEEEASK